MQTRGFFPAIPCPIHQSVVRLEQTRNHWTPCIYLLATNLPKMGSVPGTIYNLAQSQPLGSTKVQFLSDHRQVINKTWIRHRIYVAGKTRRRAVVLPSSVERRQVSLLLCTAVWRRGEKGGALQGTQATGTQPSGILLSPATITTTTTTTIYFIHPSGKLKLSLDLIH